MFTLWNVVRGAALASLFGGGLLALRRRPQPEDRFRLFAEAASEGILIHDKGVILDANAAFTAMVGYTLEELRALPRWEILVAPESRDIVWQHVISESEQPYEAVELRKDGSRVDVELSGKNFVMGARKVRAVVARDLTERRRFENRLREAQKMEAVGRLAGGVAHDFNNLLTIITGYADMLNGQLAPGDPMRGPAGEILNASRRASELARQLLAFSRRQFIQPKVTDLNEALRGMEELVRRLAGDHIAVRMLLVENLSRVRADLSQLEQVVINLVLNARDAMPGGGSIVIRTENTNCLPDDVRARTTLGPCVMLAVRDTGTGMSEKTRSHLFEPFFTTKEKGTGLGLATSYGIIKQHGGDISVVTEEGGGSEFRIYLPPTDLPVPAPPAHVAAHSHHGAGFILLVEDETNLRKMLREILSEMGYRVLEAVNGRDALDVAGRHNGPIELLVTDVMMPELNGPELADRLRALRPDTKVLFISGYTDEALRTRGAAVNFLPKPFTPSALAARIRQLLG
ncbi:MAG: ATP-binding protein [Acidobacteriota bacterium]